MTQDMTRKMMMIKKTLMMVLMVAFGTTVSWGQDYDKVYALVVDGHYMAHCGNVALGDDGQAVTAPTVFNPNTCLWATTDPANFSLLHAYGTERDDWKGGFFAKLVKQGSNTFYRVYVSKTSTNYFQTVSTEPKTLAATLTENEDDANPTHYLRYDATNGWIMTEKENNLIVYNASSKPTIKALTSMTDYTAGSTLTINCSATITYPGTTASLSASVINADYIHTVFADAENHYWYDDADHDAAPVTSSTPTSPVWSLATADAEFADIDPSTGAITVKKQTTETHTLTVNCTATVEGTTMTASKTITLSAAEYEVEWKQYIKVDAAEIKGKDATTDPVTSIDYAGVYQYSLSGIVEKTYEIRTISEVKKYWYKDSEEADPAEHDAAPAGANVTMTWSFEGGDDYATVNASTGVLSVNELPTTDTNTTLKCTIKDGETNLAVLPPVSVTLKPENIVAPTIDTTVGSEATKATITETDTRPTVYYTTGPTEYLTPKPTISSTKYEVDFEIGDDVACIKACAINEFNQHSSTVTTYNILRFTKQLDISPKTNVTVAPLIYSCNLKTPTGMTAYYVSRVEPANHSAKLSEWPYIPEGTPVLLMDNSGTNQGKKYGIVLEPIEDLDAFLHLDDEDPDNDIKKITDEQKSTNQLHVTDKKTKVDNGQVYMYYNDETEGCLFVLTLAGEMKAGRYFLYNPNYNAVTPPSTGGGDTGGGTGDGAPLHLFIEDMTGIETVHGDGLTVNGLSDRWYTLDGRRLSGKPTKKGLYINNGNKVVIK